MEVPDTRVLCVVGTRPEAVKMAPVIKRLDEAPGFNVITVATAQHRELLDDILQVFGITPDVDLNLMQSGQSLAGLTSRVLSEMDGVYQSARPDIVLVQGDTTTVMATALAAFYRGITIGHVEAGLRTGNRRMPFPEEINRVFTGHLADVHFAPTERARDNLLRAGVEHSSIVVSGNTVIDALLDVSGRPALAPPIEIAADRRLILLTAHRRENFGAPLREIFMAARRIVEIHPDVELVYPVHPNPEVTGPAREILGGVPRIHLLPPLGYVDFVAVMKRATFLLTDSGGVQEEAPALGKPVLVLRDETERPEAVEAGVARLVGPRFESIVHWSHELLNSPAIYSRMSVGASPYGDGLAASRILGALQSRYLGDISA